MKKNSKSIGSVICLAVSLMIVILCSVILFISYRSFKSNYTEQCDMKLKEILRLAADTIDVDVIDSYYKTGEYTDKVKHQYEKLQKFRDDIPSVKYLYIFKPEKERFTYVLDVSMTNDTSGIEYSSLGDVYEYTEDDIAKGMAADYAAYKPYDGTFYAADNGFGATLAAWIPLYDASGNPQYMIEADMLISECDAYVNEYIMFLIPVILILLVATIVICVILLRRIIINPLKGLTSYIQSYEEGEFKGEKFVHNQGDELTILNDSFEMMNQKVSDYNERLTKATKEKERISAELDLGRKIQATSLPTIFPPFPERDDMDLYASMDPAKEVAGDFYDFFLIDDKHLALVVGDVAGKGVGAALFMMISKTIINNQAMINASPAEILQNANERLCERNEAEMFVTVWLGIIDLSTGIMKAANAGHEFPAIRKKDGQFEYYHDKHGFVLAGMEGVRYKEYEINFEKGDTLFMYTDGVTEATDAHNELFGSDRLIDALNDCKGMGPKEIIGNVRKHIDGFVKEAPQFDDITMLSFTYIGK